MPHLDALAPPTVFVKPDAGKATDAVANARVAAESSLNRVGAHAFANVGPVLLLEKLFASGGDPLADLTAKLALPARGVGCRIRALVDTGLALSNDTGEQGEGLSEKRVSALRLLGA